MKKKNNSVMLWSLLGVAVIAVGVTSNTAFIATFSEIFKHSNDTPAADTAKTQKATEEEKIQIKKQLQSAQMSPEKKKHLLSQAGDDTVSIPSEPTVVIPEEKIWKDTFSETGVHSGWASKNSYINDKDSALEKKKAESGG